MYTITGSPSKLSGRASSVWIQLVKLQIKHFIISLPCFWMSTYKEGCSCGLLIKVLFPVQPRVPQGLLYSSSNTSLRAALCPSALSPGSQTSPAVPSHFLMTAEITGLQPTKNAEIMLLLEEEYYLSQDFFSPGDRKQNMKEPSEVKLTSFPRQPDCSWRKR